MSKTLIVQNFSRGFLAKKKKVSANVVAAYDKCHYSEKGIIMSQ